MSLEIAHALREKAATAQALAERITDAEDRETLLRLAAGLVRMAEKLERDAME